ncbi:glycosyltransferase family 2 protein [Tessaracoccus lubricantis]|uniref:Glycosyltransferase family 2 protein n=1 Tax=Tessaracoccus lubricantis TaxID=545543 RepID=A0ABP9FE56_9ACTN
MTPLTTVLLMVAIPGLIMGAFNWALHPLAVLFEFRQKTPPALPVRPRVSVVIPAYNESVVLAGCLDSVLASGYPDLELLLVDDGSSDDTLQIMRRYEADARVTVISKANGGKGSALNAGIARATGDVFVFADADGVFTPHTIPRLLEGFRHDKVGAVCGNDLPINVESPLTALLALMTHVGTGMTRRALALVGILPIVAGNSGAFRADVVRELGGFREDTVGEDLELTWRVQFSGYDVEFAPHAKVLAEVPSTLKGLWKQRVRWQRGLIQTARIHRARFEQWPSRPVDAYLPLNLLSMLALPVLQLAALVLSVVAIAVGDLRFDGLLGMLMWAGLGLALGVSVLALILDRDWRDFRLLVFLPLWVPFSVMMSCVTVAALWHEARGTEARWNKLQRTGVRTMVGRAGLASGTGTP